MSSIWYCTREDVKRAFDSKESARNDAQIDRAVAGATADVERKLHRVFYPRVATVAFDWPNFQYARGWRLWLDQNELISVTEVRSADEVIASSDYILYPNDGPPYNRIELNTGGPAAFGAGDTSQNSIEIEGLYGFTNEEVPMGDVAQFINSTDTALHVTRGTIEVGHLLRIGTERLNVTGKQLKDTTQAIGVALTANMNNVTVQVSDGTKFTVDEVILIDAERMLVVDVAGNNLIVKRAWSGSVLAEHALNTDIYAYWIATVERGAAGTTAASHNETDDVFRWKVPAGIRTVCVAQALDTVLQEVGGYSRQTGARVQKQGAKGIALADAWDMAYDSYGRKARIRGV